MSNIQDKNFDQIYTLAVKAGIKRDGTVFESLECTDGEWCRFQRQTPKKIGGYRQMFRMPDGIPRGMIAEPYNGVNYMFVGYNNGMDVFTSGTSLGLGSGPYTANITGGTIQTGIAITGGTGYTNGTYTGVSLTGGSGTGAIATIVVAASTVTTVTITTPGSGYITGDILSATAASIGGTGSGFSILLTAVTTFTPSSNNLWQYDMIFSPSGGNLQVLAHPGENLTNIDNAVKSQVLIGNMLPGSNNTWSFSGLADTGGTSPTNQPISVDGGVCVLYPFIFVYGSNGYIANNNVNSTYASQGPTDWNGPLANQVNVSASKIVKGMPVRGGTNTPSGLFWATDSLIRVSFTGTTGLYWRYDIISSQISIMSSSSVVEMDGVYYWMGVDRFYQYNGAVSVVPNDKNVNWLFDNLNYQQRQKVWATKVPRYNEIWYFYPRGTATECTDAIIYNVKDNIWYDVGSAEGARRSCGYTTEVFPSPIWCGWEYEWTTSEPHLSQATPSGETAPTQYQFYLAGNQSNQFSPGQYISFSETPGSPTYKIITSKFIFDNNTLPNGVTLVTVTTKFPTPVAVGTTVYLVVAGYDVWQQEFGLNKITQTDTLAINSSFTTCDISWVGGTPAGDSLVGTNRRIHLTRVEPDFVQGGEMVLNVIGTPFAQNPEEEVETKGPYPFDSTTGKIDLRLEYREARLQFVSNDIDGNFELGRTLITAWFGDERP